MTEWFDNDGLDNCCGYEADVPLRAGRINVRWNGDYYSQAVINAERAARRVRGTRSGYVAHQKRGEVACDACREAQRVWQRAHRQAKREQAAS